MSYTTELTPPSATNKAYQVVLYNEQQQPIGQAMGEFRQQAMWYDGHPYFFLTSLVVSDSVPRWQELGSQLLKTLEAVACDNGVAWIRGQMETKTTKQLPAASDKQSLKTFWVKNGYGLRQEIYDGSIRFWKPLQKPKRAGNGRQKQG
ncbi:hypothetical protein [Spirosoma daeguense]